MFTCDLSYIASNVFTHVKFRGYTPKKYVTVEIHPHEARKNIRHHLGTGTT